jgi:alkylation response protein AidB-like acyl-CoA dehydrogenase
MRHGIGCAPTLGPRDTPMATKQESVAQESRQLTDLTDWLRDYAARRINSQLMDERRTIAPHIVLDFGNRGLMGMQIPGTYGGQLELTTFQLLRVQRQLGAIDLTLAFFVGLNNGLGVRPILRFAQPHLKDRYLPDLAKGRILAAFAITESSAGSNPRALAATAHAETEGFRVSGSKLWCGSAAWAGVISVFARHTGANGNSAGHVGLCVDADQQGMRVGAEALTMGLRGMVQNTVHFDQALVSRDRVLASPFSGLSVASDVMGLGRLGIAATAIGGLWRALQLMVRYSKRRQINTGTLYANGHARQLVGDVWRAARLLGQFVDRIAQAIDQGESPPAEHFAAAKLLTSEALWQGADAALQMLGGRGYCDNNVISQLLRDARITRLFEGPSETLASFIGKRAWLTTGNPLVGFASNSNARTQEAGKQLQILLARVGQGASVEVCPSQDALFVPLGYAVAWQLVAAGSDAPNPEDHSWIQCQFQKAAATALSSAGGGAIPDAEQLACEVAIHIGDLQQSAEGADFELDPYLRK